MYVLSFRLIIELEEKYEEIFGLCRFSPRLSRFWSEPQAVYGSQGTLVGALEGAFGIEGPIAIPQYIPGYGLHIALYAGYEEFPERAQTAIPDILERLSTQIQGLDKDDWISVGYIAGYTPEDRKDLVVRMKQGQPGTLEVISNLSK